MFQLLINGHLSNNKHLYAAARILFVILTILLLFIISKSQSPKLLHTVTPTAPLPKLLHTVTPSAPLPKLLHTVTPSAPLPKLLHTVTPSAPLTDDSNIIESVSIESPYEIIPFNSIWPHLKEPDLNFFTDSNNETGYADPIVPNIIHFIRLNEPIVSFVEMICIKSAYLNHKPDRIMIHCNNCFFRGKYWDQIKNIPILTLHNVIPPNEIFGRKFGNIWHRSDILRILTLMRFGGIYLDNDVYVVRSLDPFRKFEMTLGWSAREFIGNQVLIAHPNARFLRFYYKTYKQYKPGLWYFNGGELPTKALLWKYPELVHRVPLKFGVHMLVINDLYKKYMPEWSKYFYVVHLFIRDKPKSVPKEFDENNILKLNVTVAEMLRVVNNIQLPTYKKRYRIEQKQK